MKTPPPITSPFAPDLGEVRARLEKMIVALKFVELVGAILVFIGRICAINAPLRAALPRAPRLLRRWNAQQAGGDDNARPS